MRTVAWPSQASVIWLSDHAAGFGLDGAGIIWRRASATRVRTRRAARCLEAAAHHVPAPNAAPVAARLYFRNFLRFGFTSLLHSRGPGGCQARSSSRGDFVLLRSLSDQVLQVDRMRKRGRLRAIYGKFFLTGRLCLGG